MTAPSDRSARQLYAAMLDEQEALCASLEAIADALPDDADRASCMRIARSLPNVIARGHTLEETQIFPKLENHHPGLENLHETLERLRFEHFSDACYAEEVSEALIAFGSGRPDVAPATLGYMLRGFFVGLRRHLAFEREIILPML